MTAPEPEVPFGERCEVCGKKTGEHKHAQDDRRDLFRRKS